MEQKHNGTCNRQIQKKLRFGIDALQAETYCCYYDMLKEPEYSSFCFDTSWMDDVDQ